MGQLSTERRRFLKSMASFSFASVGEKFLTLTTPKPPASPEQVSYLLQNHLDPIGMIERHVRSGVSLVGLGEEHNEAAMEKFALDVIKNLRGKGLLHFLSLEIDTCARGELRKYMETGEIGPHLGNELDAHTKTYQEILEYARQTRLTVICADDRLSGSRDDFMSWVNLVILDNFPEAKGVFYAGSGHIKERKDLLADRLKEKYYSVIMLNEVNGDAKDTVYDAFVRSGMKKIVGIDNVSYTPFSECTLYQAYEDWSQYGKITDALVLIPPLGSIV